MPQSIVSTLNQPIRYFSDDDATCKCGERESCILIEPNQQVYSQLKIFPCGEVEVCNNELGDELICNGSFDLGPELVTNGTFDGNADGWTLGTNWAYGTNNACATSADAGETLSQTIAITSGSFYYVTFTIENYSAGDIRAELGGTTGTTRSADGTYTELIDAGAGTDIVFNNVGTDFTGCITDVSVRLLDCWSHDSGWTWTAGLMCGDGAQNLAQEIAALVDFDDYQVTFTISDYVSGDLTVTLGGTAYATTFNADGTYSIVINNGNADDNLFFSGAGTFEGCIDDVSIQRIESCWDADETDWNISSTGACHVPGNTTDLTNTGTTIQNGFYYHITIAVSEATAGGINIVLGTNVLTPTTGDPETAGNGVFHFWGTSNGTTIAVRPTTDFDGCISTLTVDEYCNEYQFHLIPAEGDEYVVYDLTPHYTLEQDVFNLTDFHLSDIFIDGERDSPLPFGCYRLCLVDCCAEQQTASSLLLNGNFATSCCWTLQDAIIGSGILTLPGGSGARADVNFFEQALISTHEADCLELSFFYGNEYAFAQNLEVWINGVLVETTPLDPGAHTYTGTFMDVPAGAIIRFLTRGLRGDVLIDNVTATVPEECLPLYDQCTPCINYQASFQCTKLIEGYCDGNALGFNFDDTSGNNQFKLSLRAKCDLLHPTYEQDQEDYDFSDGNTSLSFGQSAKWQSLTFFPLPEFKHDVIALEKVCDTFQIDTVDYFVKKGDYTPEWNRNTSTDLAPSRIEVKKKNQTLYNTNCS